jgi:hypothetical protein
LARSLPITLWSRSGLLLGLVAGLHPKILRFLPMIGTRKQQYTDCPFVASWNAQAGTPGSPTRGSISFCWSQFEFLIQVSRFRLASSMERDGVDSRVGVGEGVGEGVGDERDAARAVCGMDDR